MGALSEQELAAFSADFNKDNKNKVASRAARQNGLFEASFNDEVSKRLNHTFSTELDIGGVTDQKHSGRCWEFASLNVLRHHFGKNIMLKTLLSHKHTIFSGIKLKEQMLFMIV